MDNNMDFASMTEEEKREREKELWNELKALRSTMLRSDWHAGFESVLRLDTYDYGAGVQINSAADLARAIGNGNINLGDGQISFGDTTVNFGNENAESTIVNLFNNQGRKQKVAYTHSEGGTVDASGERESMLLVGNTGNKNGESRLTAGNGNDTAIGGSGDYFDLGGGNNYVEIGRRGNTEGATVAMTTSNSQTEVSGFNTGYDENSDKVRIDTANAKVSFAGGKITFSVDGSKLILNVGLGSSADLFDDDNFIGSTTIDDITPITYEQGEYQNIYDSNNNSLKCGFRITFTGA